MNFWKMNGAGNDFVVLNNQVEQLSPDCFPALARLLCHRQLSIGADGFMVVDTPTSHDADYRMWFFNADGSVGEMCGNGARCICRYGYENGLAGERQRVETTAGLVIGERMDARYYRVALNPPTTIELSRPASVDGVEYPCAYVELGTPGLPHVVLQVKDLDAQNTDTLRELGRSLRWHSAFPKGANVNFCECIGEDTIRIRTFERGVEDFTLACGTGSASTALILTKLGLVSGTQVRLLTDGEELRVDVVGSDLFLAGPTNVAAKGVVTDDNLSSVLG